MSFKNILNMLKPDLLSGSANVKQGEVSETSEKDYKLMPGNTVVYRPQDGLGFDYWLYTVKERKYIEGQHSLMVKLSPVESVNGGEEIELCLCYSIGSREFGYHVLFGTKRGDVFDINAIDDKGIQFYIADGIEVLKESRDNIAGYKKRIDLLKKLEEKRDLETLIDFTIAREKYANTYIDENLIGENLLTLDVRIQKAEDILEYIRKTKDGNA